MEGRDDELPSECPRNSPCKHTPERGSTHVTSQREITAHATLQSPQGHRSIQGTLWNVFILFVAAALDKFAPFLEGCFINTQVKSISHPQQHSQENLDESYSN